MISNTEILKLHKKYSYSEKQFKLCYEHGQIVAEIALWCANNSKLAVDNKLLEAICLLHDIGSYLVIDENGTRNEFYYSLHAIVGSKILQEEGIDSKISEAIETHILLGLTPDEIIKSGRVMPFKNYEPKTIEAKLLCYADRFHTKDPAFYRFDTYYNKILMSFPKQAEKFEQWAIEFGKPDVEALAKKYNHPIK